MMSTIIIILPLFITMIVFTNMITIKIIVIRKIYT